ncbi:ATPase AAA [Sorangium cellulosum]|uniref:ATPase AAA n=1 Tax=Sorangium cellulosum TaxID=56 RepID=A0A2L0ET70_SORCE|nr:MoxR family ATPase [Sorangium cellulosum]AUX42483.1 ATPase AAA [Sorangium cellulosum]
MSQSDDKWLIFNATGQGKDSSASRDGIAGLPPPPPWRRFHGAPHERELPAAEPRAKLEIGREEKELVNAAIYLRRPLLVTGRPGTGKSSLAHAIAHELGLGPALTWPINTRSTLQEGLYRYDAIGRLQEKAELDKIGRYIRLGPLGTALLPSKRPRVLLIDEIDKSDLDFPNDLLNVLEEGWFEIPELSRLPEEQQIVSVRPHDGGGDVPVTRGRVECFAFPVVVMTSNGERDFPAPFLRRCVRLEMKGLDEAALERIVEAHFGALTDGERGPTRALIKDFLKRCETADRATDQLLNAVYLVIKHRVDASSQHAAGLRDALLRELK